MLRPRGFTLSELLISVAIISIAMLAALASLTFGIKATDQSGHTTEALNLERRIMEVILSGCHPPVTAGPALVYIPANHFGSYANGTPPAAPVAGVNWPTAGTSWIPLSQFLNNNVSPFTATDFENSQDANDALRIQDQSTRYYVNISSQQHPPWSGEGAAAATGDPSLASTALFDVEVDVGWWEKSTAWKTISTQAIYHYRVTF
jgi:prepilin-type N-terminal cleavage/methylation domain-containing protein